MLSPGSSNCPGSTRCFLIAPRSSQISVPLASTLVQCVRTRPLRPCARWRIPLPCSTPPGTTSLKTHFLQQLLGTDLQGAALAVTAAVVQLPVRSGGLGLDPASRLDPVAFLGVLGRCVCHDPSRNLPVDALLSGNLQSSLVFLVTENVVSATDLLRCGSATDVPVWPDLAAGDRPTALGDVGPRGLSEYARAWQRVSANTRSAHSRQQLLSLFSRSNQALFRSHSGFNEGRVLSLLAFVTQIQTGNSQVFLLRRCRLLLTLTAHRRQCHRLPEPSQRSPRSLFRSTCLCFFLKKLIVDALSHRR